MLLLAHTDMGPGMARLWVVTILTGNTTWSITEQNGTKHDAKNKIKMPFYDFNGVARTYLDKNNDPNIAELGSGPYICDT